MIDRSTINSDEEGKKCNRLKHKKNGIHFKHVKDGIPIRQLS